ncbi:MAG: LysR family transcriptional regulator [Pseudolabrys sp.]|nr:LysR family transcriptional regulator [Pseudolabrys sp.]MBV9953727.1 LysR family transcriptional regulator [Pseudolabrys sp.]
MRSLNLDQLRAFIEVVERGSFTAAAKQLNLSQPAITHQVHELEKRFKVTLIERLGKRAYPTPAGEKLIEHARQLLEEDARTRSAMRSFDDRFAGRVRIGTSATVLMYALPPILRRLKTEHPQLELVLKAGLTATTLKLLKSNALDLGLCALPVADREFEVTPLFDDDLVAILPKTVRNVPKRVSPKYLSECPLILGNEESALRRSISEWLARDGAQPKPVMTFDNVEAIKSLVAVGLGCSIVPRLCLGQGHVGLTNAKVAALSPRLTRRIALVRLRHKPPTDALNFVIAGILSLREPVGRRPA